MTHKWLEPDYTGKPSSWLLFFGIILCCTGVGVPAGLVMCFLYFWKDHHSRDKKFAVDELDPRERKAAL